MYYANGMQNTCIQFDNSNNVSLLSAESDIVLDVGTIMRLTISRQCFVWLLLVLSIIILIFMGFEFRKGRILTPESEQWGKNVDGDTSNSILSYHSPSSDIIMLPLKEKILNMTHREVANLYHSYINSLQVLCRKIVRVGVLEDGGWEICEDSNYHPHRPCLVYSFGINYEYSFDDDIVRRYGCEVHSFDPSMRNETDHRRGALGYFHKIGLGDFNQVNPSGWQLKRLGTIQRELGHTNKKIDVLKMDIEEWEWRTIPDMLKSGALSNVRQFVTELHINLHFEPMEEAYKMGLSTLKDLYDEGFRIFWTHRNLWCKFMSRFVSEMRSGCHEVSFLKVS